MSNQGSPTKDAVARVISSLEDEVILLGELADAASRARTAPPDGETGGLHRLLERQAELCAALDGHRRERACILKEWGHRANDLLVMVLGGLPKDDHPRVVDLFKTYVDAAEAAQREIDVNREFFSVALATLEDTIDAVVASVSAKGVYDATGNDAGSQTALCVSTVT